MRPLLTERRGHAGLKAYIEPPVNYTPRRLRVPTFPFIPQILQTRLSYTSRGLGRVDHGDL